MDTEKAIALNKAAIKAGARPRVLDWRKAATIIKKEAPEVVEAGLLEDWEYTGGEVYRDGECVHNSYTYLKSNWATPGLMLDGDFVECWVWVDETEWDADTRRLEEALEALARMKCRVCGYAPCKCGEEDYRTKEAASEVRAYACCGWEVETCDE